MHTKMEQLGNIHEETYTVSFDRDRYSEMSKITDWCFDNLGPGHWYDQASITGRSVTWSVSIAFGHTTFTFKKKSDLTLFLARFR